MKLSHIAALGLALALFMASAVAEKPAALKSGPQVGEELAGPFHPLNVNGKAAGKKSCLYCSNGPNPVALVFAREATPAVAKLAKKLEETVAKNASARMGSYFVFCSSEDGLEAKLKDMAKTADLKNVVLSIDNPAGPKGYNVAKDADVTVVLYVEHTVKANFTFAKDKLTDKAIEEIVAATSKITK